MIATLLDPLISMQHTTDADAYTQRRTGVTKEAAESVAAAVDCVSIETDEPPEETKDVSGVDDEDDGVVIFVVVMCYTDGFDYYFSFCFTLFPT